MIDEAITLEYDTERLANGNFLSPYKLCYHAERLQQWLETGVCPPISASFDMTLRCNHRCPACPYRKYEITEQFMDWSNVRNALDNLARNGIRGILFTGGGEPLCNPYTLDAICYAYSLGMRTALITNGEELTPNAAQSILQYCDWVRVSLDSASSHTHRLMHGVGTESFNKIVGNINGLIDLRRSQRSKTTIGIAMLTCSHTISEMVKFAELCNSLNVDYCQFRPLQNPSKSDVALHKEHFTKNIAECRNVLQGQTRLVASSMKYNSLLFGHTPQSGNCHATHFSIVVGADANIYVCVHNRYNNACITSCILDTNWISSRQEFLQRKKIVKASGRCPRLCKHDNLNRFLNNIIISGQHNHFI